MRIDRSDQHEGSCADHPAGQADHYGYTMPSCVTPLRLSTPWAIMLDRFVLIRFPSILRLHLRYFYTVGLLCPGGLSVNALLAHANEAW